jgi:hypothetical protein
MWKHCTFHCEIFRCGEVPAPIPLSLLILHKLSFPVVGLKMSYLPTLALKYPNIIFILYLGNLSSTRLVSTIFCVMTNCY